MLQITNLSDIHGNSTVIYAINTLLSRGKFPKFTILYGQMGVGKSSVAKLILDELTKESNVMSAKQIYDVASNLPLDEIDEIYIKHTPMYPVAILLEEIHMLSKEKQTSLLTLLDRQPKNVYFIATTTEMNKLLKPLQSRAQAFEFKRLNQSQMKTLMEDYLSTLGVGLTQNVKDALIYKARGIPRDLIKDIDLMVDGEFSDEQAEDLLGFLSDELLFTVFTTIKSDALSFVEIISTLFDSKQTNRVQQLTDFWVRYLLCRKGGSTINIDKNHVDVLNDLYTNEADLRLITNTLIRVTERTLELELLGLNLKLTSTSSKEITGVQISAQRENATMAISSKSNADIDRKRINSATIGELRL